MWSRWNQIYIKIYHHRRQIHQRLTCQIPVLLFQYNVSPSRGVKNLSAIFDSGNSFDNHISSISQACYYHQCDLHLIFKFLSVNTAIFVANTLVCWHLDYYNTLLCDVTGILYIAFAALCAICQWEFLDTCAIETRIYTPTALHDIWGQEFNITVILAIMMLLSGSFSEHQSVPLINQCVSLKKLIPIWLRSS